MILSQSPHFVFVFISTVSGFLSRCPFGFFITTASSGITTGSEVTSGIASTIGMTEIFDFCSSSSERRGTTSIIVFFALDLGFGLASSPSTGATALLRALGLAFGLLRLKYLA